MVQELPAPAPVIAEARPALARAYARTGLDLGGLWLRYVALGGNADPMEIDGYLHGVLLPTPGEHNVLACAVNERLDELGDGQARVPYC
jgi:hypothetical protein